MQKSPLITDVGRSWTRSTQGIYFQMFSNFCCFNRVAKIQCIFLFCHISGTHFVASYSSTIPPPAGFCFLKLKIEMVTIHLTKAFIALTPQNTPILLQQASHLVPPNLATSHHLICQGQWIDGARDREADR